MLRFARCGALLCAAVAAAADPAGGMLGEAHDSLVLLQTSAGALRPGRGGGTRDMLMVAHHKTGMVLALQASECINASSAGVTAFKRPARFHQGGPPEGMAMIHFTRDLHDLAISAYMYHRYSSQEPMHIRRGSAMQIKSTVKRMGKFPQEEMDWYETNERESYQRWLNRVPTEIGLRAQIGQLIPQINQMKNLSTYCKSHTGDCIEVDLKDFTASTESFNAAWRSIFQFVGVHVDQHEDLEQCLAKLDENNPTFKPEDEGPRMVHHVTSTRLTPEEHEDMVRTIQAIDSQFYHDVLNTAMEE